MMIRKKRKVGNGAKNEDSDNSKYGGHVNFIDNNDVYISTSLIAITVTMGMGLR